MSDAIKHLRALLDNHDMAEVGFDDCLLDVVMDLPTILHALERAERIEAAATALDDGPAIGGRLAADLHEALGRPPIPPRDAWA